MDFTRRKFIAASLAAAVPAQAEHSRPTLCIFSKHLPKLNYDDLGRVSREIGFGGVDLTVRPAGHVLPARAAEDLPRAVEAIRSHGLSVPMITTGLTSPDDPAAKPTISTAGRLNIPCFKLGYWRYKPNVTVDATLASVKTATRGLAAMAAEYKTALGIHNHSGDYVGVAVWDTREVLSGLDPKWAGYYFDPCHATAEGGVYGWQLSARLAFQNLKMVAVKDFYWAKTGWKWKMTMCPLGQGMVDWPKFLKMLSSAPFNGPLTLHVEYEVSDEHAAIARDFEYLKKQVDAAYASS
jgi:L-ribulose-5-phosphate 3-epimerase